MLCLEGNGALGQVSVRNRPDVFNEPLLFGAVKVKGAPGSARLLEGPVPGRKVFGPPLSGNGSKGKRYGLPRFEEVGFTGLFPFGEVRLRSEDYPLEAFVEGWSPFIPGEADDSSLPLAVVEYVLTNRSADEIEGTFSFHGENFMRTGEGGDSVEEGRHGFILKQEANVERPTDAGAFGVSLLEEGTMVDCRWFRGGWFDALTLLWKQIESAEGKAARPFETGRASPGGSVYAPFRLEAGQVKRFRVLLTWYVPVSDLRMGGDCGEVCPCGPEDYYQPWYGRRFPGVEAVTEYGVENLERLRAGSEAFRDCLAGCTLPQPVMDAVSANLSILKSPTVLRAEDGRIWAWEGCHDEKGCCFGSCTHVWNYAQALPHLFPELERTLRESEFGESQGDSGHQTFRTAIPIREQPHDGHAAADGQLGGLLKVYRDWRISGDTDWMRGLWPAMKGSLEYCIETWDPDRIGVLVEPHHNTYDIEFWGPDGMCSSFYLGALRAMVAMGQALGEPVDDYAGLYEKGRAYLEERLFNGEFFIQDIRWEGMRAGDPTEVKPMAGMDWPPEALELLQAEGPRYQYGSGCLSDGVIGDWMARVCGLEPILEPALVRRHLQSVFEHNFIRDLRHHVNPQRPGYALGREGGLVLCSWPRGGALSLPFPYSDEVWTGIEYEVASHLMCFGEVEAGLEIVRTARERYDGKVRNPFNEYECGHWYARALSSYALLQGLTGIRYDAVDRVLTIAPRIPGDFRSFLATATGFGTVGVRDGAPFVEVARGEIPFSEIRYEAFEGGS